MSKNNGGPAFPNLKANSCGPKTSGEAGMTLRDWFAGQVLSGMWAGGEGDFAAEQLAEVAYQQADAMLAERDK